MKKNHKIVVLLVALLICKVNQAQELPLTSTSSSPIWYYIQVKGSGQEREGLVFTSEGSTVYGRTMLDGVTSPTTVSTQLWRFESEGDGWFSIINKHTGQKMNIAYDDSRQIGFATLSDVPACKFKLMENASTEGYYTICSSAAATGGNASEIYLHQANNGANRNYVIMLVDSYYGFGVNSAFNFVLFNDYAINFSDETSENWYNIISGKTGINDFCIKDNSQNPSAAFELSVEPIDNNNLTQQWKLVKEVITGRTKIINRSTGKCIIPASIAIGVNNITQLNTTDNNGWNLEYLGKGQYSISGKEEDDDITRYLHLSYSDMIPEEYETDKAIDSEFAWLVKAIAPTSGTNELPKSETNIKVINNRIYVNADTYSITSINGIVMKKQSLLPPGIYLVTVNGTTTKVFVK